MSWIIGIIIVGIALAVGGAIIGICREGMGSLINSEDIVVKVMLFTSFLLVLSFVTSRFFPFMGVLTSISGVVLIGSLILKVFQKIFMG